jgi:hypothetical protein
MIDCEKRLADLHQEIDVLKLVLQLAATDDERFRLRMRLRACLGAYVDTLNIKIAREVDASAPSDPDAR